MDFVYLLRVLLKKKWIIIGAGVLAVAVAYFFTRNQPKKFRSVSQMSTGFTVNEEIKISNENFSLYEADTKFNNVIVTALSQSVLSILSYTLILHDLTEEHPFRKLTAEQMQHPVYKAVKKEDAIKVYRQKLQDMTMLNNFKPEEKKLQEYLKLYGYDYRSLGASLSVYRMQRTDYVQFDFTSENPELSAFVVNNAYEVFLRYYRNLRGNRSQEAIDTLKSIMDARKADLDNINRVLRSEGFVTDGSTSSLDLIASLEQTLTAERARQVMLYSELRKVNTKIANTPSSTTTTPVRTTDNNELLTLRKAMNDAYTDYLNSGSSDQALLARYTQLKTQYQNKMLNSGASSGTSTTTTPRRNNADLLEQKQDLEIDIESAGKTIASIQSQIGSLKGSVSADASRSVTVDGMMKDADQANKEYLAAKERYTSATEIGTSNVNNFRQILVGQPALDPEPSKRKLLVGMAGAAAIIFTILVFVFITYLDSSIKTPAIFSRMVNLNLISMINFMNLKNRNLADIISRKEQGDDPNDKQRLNVFRESLRKLRYEVEKSGKKVFLFASTQKGQGKTTLIQALSFSLSKSKKKILIIDTNFSNNDLTVQLNAEPILEKIRMPKGLNGTEYIQEVVNLSSDIEDGSIYAIGSEGGDYTPSEVLPRENILQNLQELTKEFDYIFLEGPPLNDFSDAKELSQYVEGVIAVFSATHIMKQIDKESIKFFKELNGKFVGSILNKVDLENVQTS